MILTAIDVLESQVIKGRTALDIHCPGWRSRVNIDAIEAGCNVHSVTGQLFGPEIPDQMIGVGFDLDSMTGDEACTLFGSMGFCVMQAEPVPTPDAIRQAFLDTLGVTVPAVMPIPRDLDVIRMEADGLTVLWQREAARQP